MPPMTLDELTQAIRSRAEKNPALGYKIKFEVDEGNAGYAWLNRTAVVGHGILDLTEGTMTYEMGVLRWDGDGRGER